MIYERYYTRLRKIRILIYIVVGTFSFTMINCERDPNNDGNSITYYRTKFGGCNGQQFDLKSTFQDNPDTVVISIEDGTLNVFVGINYICCAPFTTEANIVSDSLLMVISDTCSYPYQTCYCRCYCYYTFDFQFINFDEKVYDFLIELNDPQIENPIVIQKGEIDPTEY